MWYPTHFESALQKNGSYIFEALLMVSTNKANVYIEITYARRFTPGVLNWLHVSQVPVQLCTLALGPCCCVDMSFSCHPACHSLLCVHPTRWPDGAGLEWHPKQHVRKARICVRTQKPVRAASSCCLSNDQFEFIDWSCGLHYHDGDLGWDSANHVKMKLDKLHLLSLQLRPCVLFGRNFRKPYVSSKILNAFFLWSGKRVPTWPSQYPLLERTWSWCSRNMDFVPSSVNSLGLSLGKGSLHLLVLQVPHQSHGDLLSKHFELCWCNTRES